VQRADGPERICGEWWRGNEAAALRDYYRVEDEAGRRFWLYRDGLYWPKTAPRWFLHGFFA
jgi:protein ImuB